MRLHHLVLMAMMPSTVLAEFDLNGWYPCSDTTFSDEGSSSGQIAQCAVHSAPLCYPGVCKTPATVDDKIDVFVKRLLATSGDPNATMNVWLLQGGPGASSTTLESTMKALQTQLGGAINVYTMDHRGTGRSTLLDCVAAQATTTGSPSGKSVAISEIPACANALEKKFGDLSSFSITSVATDLSSFIANFSNGAGTIVYGVSYGTALVERLMHLKPPGVVGYVLDGIATSSGAPGDKFEFFSQWDTNFGEVGDEFLARCANESSCSSHFKTKSLPVVFEEVLTNFASNPNSTCASLVDTNNPSYTLRETLGSLLQSAQMRTFIPPVIYRLARCQPKDVTVLKHFFEALNSGSSTSQDNAFFSTLIFNLVGYSDMWEQPQPSKAEMLKRFTDTKLCADPSYSEIEEYCAYSKEDSPTCNEFSTNKYAGNGIIYKRDQYWNKSATIPNNASVLLLSGKLDPQAPHKFAEYLLEALNGDNKELIGFDHATHGAIVCTPLAGGGTCGMNLLVSYVNQSGVLKNLDRSCVDKLPAFNLSTPGSYRDYYFSTKDAYDGEFLSSASRTASTQAGAMGAEEEESTYKTAFISFLVLFVLALGAAAFFAYRWVKLLLAMKRATKNEMSIPC